LQLNPGRASFIGHLLKRRYGLAEAGDRPLQQSLNVLRQPGRTKVRVNVNSHERANLKKVGERGLTAADAPVEL
jgi:hypothetical protein